MAVIHILADRLQMPQLKLDRMSANYALLLARRRVANHPPFSPAWDAAMHVVEDCEREAYRLDQLWLERIAPSI
jgi:hypothetical protein